MGLKVGGFVASIPAHNYITVISLDSWHSRSKITVMTKFYSPNLGVNPEDPFARDAEDKLVRRAYWLGLSDQSIVLAMTQGVGVNIPNDQKKAHLDNIGRGHLIDDVCRQEILPPET